MELQQSLIVIKTMGEGNDGVYCGLQSCTNLGLGLGTTFWSHQWKSKERYQWGHWESLGSGLQGNCYYQARFLQIRVELPLDKPIRRGAPVLSPKGVRVQIAFQYECLVGLCFSYGKLGLEARDCLNQVLATTSERIYREWLKTGFRCQAKLGGRSFRA